MEKEEVRNYLTSWMKDYLKQQFQQGMEKGDELRKKTGEKLRRFILLSSSLICLIVFSYGVFTDMINNNIGMMILFILCIIGSISFAILALKK